MKTIDETEPTAPVIHVSPSPHLVQTASSTRRMMVDVMIALDPASSEFYETEAKVYETHCRLQSKG